MFPHVDGELRSKLLVPHLFHGSKRERTLPRTDSLFIPYGYDTSGLAPFTGLKTRDSFRSRGFGLSALRPTTLSVILRGLPRGLFIASKPTWNSVSRFHRKKSISKPRAQEFAHSADPTFRGGANCATSHTKDFPILVLNHVYILIRVCQVICAISF